MKLQGKPISALTAYDYSSSRLADEAGVDLLLVGDSLAMVVLGHENTMAVTWMRCCITPGRYGGQYGELLW